MYSVCRLTAGVRAAVEVALQWALPLTALVEDAPALAGKDWRLWWLRAQGAQLHVEDAFVLRLLPALRALALAVASARGEVAADVRDGDELPVSAPWCRLRGASDLTCLCLLL